jgi:hypothetical protein
MQHQKCASYDYVLSTLNKKIQLMEIITKKGNKMKKILMHKYAHIFRCYENEQILTSTNVIQNLHKIECIISCVNDTIICNLISFDEYKSTLARRLNYKYVKNDTITKYKKHMLRIDMKSVFEYEHKHTFFEMLMMIQLIYELDEKMELDKYDYAYGGNIINDITKISYNIFKYEVFNKLRHTKLITNIEFIKKLLLIDYDYYDYVKLHQNAIISKKNILIWEKQHFKITEHVYHNVLNDNLDIEQILQRGPHIELFEEFKYFSNKYKTSKICEFLDDTLKQNNDILIYALDRPYLNLTLVSQVFKHDMVTLLSLMVDNNIINENNLMSFIDENNINDDNLHKLLKHVDDVNQNVDIKTLSMHNDFKKVSYEIKKIGKNIFDDCVICMNKFTCYPDDCADNKLVRITCCNKLMHKKCANDWKSKMANFQLKCPLCCTKINVNLNKYIFDERRYNFDEISHISHGGYSGDFDGDEMNIFLSQDMQTHNELEEIAHTNEYDIENLAFLD